MASEAFQLAILLTLKDGASGGLDRFEAKLRSAGKEGEHFAKDLERIRANLSRDLAIGGVGIAGLALLKKGVDAAADYQSVMTDLRATIAQTGKDGIVDRNKLATDMLAAEAVAVRLGNKLPGTTADFAEMMQVLKQNGLDTKTIVNGAADAVGNLAVASNAMPKEIAADFAQFGNLFRLRAEDFTPAADVFSRIYSSTGQTSQELVEAAKYFQGRSGASLGLGGLKDAEQMTRLFGLLGKQGMRGSMAGMGLTNFFTEYNAHRDKLVDLQKQTGIKLDFFDKKGKFVGIDSVIQQMSQFDKLSAKDRTAWMHEIFGTLGSGVGNVLVGADAWKTFNAEQDKTISLTDKTAMKAATYNNQMEALQGTLTNLKVAVFEPMLPGLTATVNKANELVGHIQLFTKTHPDLAKYAVTFAAIGSASMVAYSGVKMLTTGVRLFKMASMFSRGEGLAAHLTAASTAASSLTAKDRALQQLGGTIAVTGEKTKGLATQLGSADKKAAGLRGNLFSLNNIFKAVLVLEAVGFTWDQIANLRKTIGEWQSMNRGHDSIGKTSYSAYQRTPTGERNPQKEAKDMLLLLEAGNKEFTKAFDPSKRTWTDFFAFGKGAQLYQGKPSFSQVLGDPQLYGRAQQLQQLPFKQSLVDGAFANVFDRVAAEVAAVKNLQQRAPSLADPAVMSSFRKDALPNMGLSDVKQQFVNQLLQQAFPESFGQSIQMTADQVAVSFSSLQQPINETVQLLSGLPMPITETTGALSDLLPPVTDTGKAFIDTTNAARPLPGAFNNIFVSATGVAESLNSVSLKLANWQPPAASNVSVVTPPGFAVGGRVTRSGLAFIHAGEDIVPARATRNPFSGSSSLFDQPTASSRLDLASLLNNLQSSAPTAAGKNGSPVVLNYSPQITINGPATKETVADFRKQLRNHAREIERMMAKGASNGRVRA